MSCITFLPRKVNVFFQEWDALKTLKQLRGFLGLLNYYKRFIKGYGQVANSLIDSLKKDSFHWTTNA